MDDSGLANCVVFSCQRPAVKDMAYCTAHLSLIPEPSPPAPVDDLAPVPAAPDMATMEAEWDGENWILKPKRLQTDLQRIRELVIELANALGLEVV